MLFRIMVSLVYLTFEIVFVCRDREGGEERR